MARRKPRMAMPPRSSVDFEEAQAATRMKVERDGMVIRPIGRPALRAQLLPAPEKTPPSRDGRAVEFILVAAHDARLAPGDTWVDGEGTIWEIADLFPKNGYELRGRVVRGG